VAVNQSCDFCEQVTVWHFLSDGVGGAVYHAAVYEAAVVCAERADEVRMRRHGVAEMRGFLFPTGHILPVTPAVGCDFIARGDHTVHETPTAAAGDGVQIYLFCDVVRPPRLPDGTMTEWVQFTANADV